MEDRRAWCALVHGVTKSRTRLNNNKLLSSVTVLIVAAVLNLKRTEAGGGVSALHMS